MALPAIAPGTGMAIGAGINALGSALGGGGEEQKVGNLHLVNRGQRDMWNQMYQGLMRGGGDFGFGSNYKQGKSQVQDFMASHGIKMDPSSGAYAGAMGNMTGQALGMDAQARNQYALQVLGQPMQIASTTGANFLESSPSAGMDPNRQYEAYRRDRYGNAAIDAKDAAAADQDSAAWRNRHGTNTNWIG